MEAKNAAVNTDMAGIGEDVHKHVGTIAIQASREEVDSRSVFVNNVHIACTPEEVQQHFQSCGTVNRVTIRNGGFAYVEFLEVEAVGEALMLNESELHRRQLMVLVKHTNQPGMRKYRRRPSYLYPTYEFQSTPLSPFSYTPYGYGRVPRYRRPNHGHYCRVRVLPTLFKLMDALCLFKLL